jgi:uncharacterized OsmC-like protein
MKRIVSGAYVANKSITLQHDLSGQEITTDLAPAQGGGGKSFSPTDLLATALGSCMATLGGIAAEREGLSLAGSRIEVEKRVDYQDVAGGATPKIQGFVVTFRLPKSLTERQRQAIERGVATCPVTHALRPEVEVTTHYAYDL